MNCKFISIEQRPEPWFWVVDRNISVEEYDLMLDQLSEKNPMLCFIAPVAAYLDMAKKYGQTVIVRPNGSWMTLSKEHIIKKEIFSEKFPD